MSDKNNSDKYKKKFHKHKKMYKEIKNLEERIYKHYPRNKYFKALIQKVDTHNLYNNFICRENYKLSIVKFDDWSFDNEKFLKVNKDGKNEIRYGRLRSIYHVTEDENAGNKAIKKHCEVDFYLKGVIEDYTRGISRYLSDSGMLGYKISNGFTKMYEILHRFNLIPKDVNTFNSYHMAEAPGQFVLCTKRFIETRRNGTEHEWYANSLNPYNEDNIAKYGKNIFDDRYGLMKKDKD